jgi:hypothetical protein
MTRQGLSRCLSVTLSVLPLGHRHDFLRRGNDHVSRLRYRNTPQTGSAKQATDLTPPPHSVLMRSSAHSPDDHAALPTALLHTRRWIWCAYIECPESANRPEVAPQRVIDAPLCAPLSTPFRSPHSTITLTTIPCLVCAAGLHGAEAATQPRSTTISVAPNLDGLTVGETRTRAPPIDLVSCRFRTSA